MKGEYRQQTLPVDKFEPNPWGLYQVHGNVWDMLEDCYHDSYADAPSDGSAWTFEDCGARRPRRLLEPSSVPPRGPPLQAPADDRAPTSAFGSRGRSTLET